MSEKVSINNTQSEKSNIPHTPKIPASAWWLVSIGAIIAGALGWSNAYLQVDDSGLVFLLSALIAFAMGMIPVCLATFLNRKHSTGIYWLTFFSVWGPAGILLWLIAIIWAIFDKKRQ